MSFSPKLAAPLDWANLKKDPKSEQTNRVCWNQIIACIRRVATNPEVSSALQRLLHVKKAEFKRLSHRGALYYGKGRYKDAGNWKYSVAYLLLCRCSPGTDLERILQELMKIYASLDPSAHYSYPSLSMQGDVIECILEACRETGPVVDKDTIAQRVAANKELKFVCEHVEELRKVICNYQRVSDSEWPAPAVFVETVDSTLGA